GWAHVVCALYIPEVQFANVLTMEPIVLQYVPHDRYNKTCYICEDHGRESRAASGACMTCNRPGCRQAFHVTWYVPRNTPVRFIISCPRCIDSHCI
ncbi:UNVERIFIED_CONTAM: hypothetical protein FKN15_057435, partial [Acipenser sinensis]